MPPRSNKPRILYLMKILYECTDSKDGLSLPEIQDRLADLEITSERKALYRDIAALQEFGFQIEKLPTRPPKYYFANRLFDFSELLLLIDSVQSSRSITEATSKDIIDKLKTLTSFHMAERIQTNIHVSDRVKMQNESIFGVLDNIQTAIAERRDISFDYMRYDANLKLTHSTSSKEERHPRIKTPLFLVYTDEKYYLAVFDENTHDNVKIYRVDRMFNVLLLGSSPSDHRLPADFDIAKYERRTPGMFDEEPQRVGLLVKERLVSNIVDLFGIEETTSTYAKDLTSNLKASETNEERWAQMSVRVAPSPVFFGQVAQFGGDVRIISPKKVVADFKAHISNLAEAQSNY